MKKVLAILLTVLMIVSMAACAKTEPNTTKGTEAANDTKTTEPAASGETTGSDEILPAFGKKASDLGVVLVVNTNLGDHAICDLSNEGLQEAAAKRMQYPDLSLTALCGCFDPAVSKSGLSHRMKKLEALAENLRQRQQEGQEAVQ